MGDEETKKLAEEILNDYAPDWTIRLGSETEANINMKLIWISKTPEEPIFYVFEKIIHEVAHIGQKQQSNRECHNPEFYERMGKLLIKYAYLVDKFK